MKKTVGGMTQGWGGMGKQGERGHSIEIEEGEKGTGRKEGGEGREKKLM